MAIHFYKPGVIFGAPIECTRYDQDADHVTMDIRDYRSIVRDYSNLYGEKEYFRDQIDRAKKNKEEEIEALKAQLAACKKQRDAAVEEARVNARRHDPDDLVNLNLLRSDLARAEKKLKDAEKALEEQAGDHEALLAEKRKNFNLIRVARERANQAREIRPYKRRSGYLLISMAPASAAHLKAAPDQVCRVRMQTPYAIGLDPESVRAQVSEDCDKYNFWAKLAVKKIYDAFEVVRDARSGYYETDFYTSESTGPIDQDFIQDNKQTRR